MDLWITYTAFIALFLVISASIVIALVALPVVLVLRRRREPSLVPAGSHHRPVRRSDVEDR